MQDLDNFLPCHKCPLYRLPEYPHNMVADFPQEAQSKRRNANLILQVDIPLLHSVVTQTNCDALWEKTT